MRPLVHVQSAQPDEPASAAHKSCAWILDAIAARRGLTTMVDSWAPLPGATVTPWVLRGIVAAIPAHAATRRVFAFGDAHVAQRVFDAAGVVAHAHACAAELRTCSRLRLQVAGSARDAAVPREWIGTNLVFATPMAHRIAPSAGARTGRARMGSRAPSNHFWGPASGALATLARACRLEGNAAQLTRFGASLAREVFASATLVVDATWWAPVDAAGIPVGSALPIEHCVASPSLASTNAAPVLDAWLGGLLGHPPRGEGPGVRVTPRIAGERGPWPRAPLPPAGPSPRGLAGRAVEAVWAKASTRAAAYAAGHRSGSSAHRNPAQSRAALAPPTPGRFARVWAAEMR